jgi:hypothetical protein
MVARARRSRSACPVAGTVSLIVLERFCDEVLGWHPRMLYGDAYDHAAFTANRRGPQQDREANR